MENDRYQKELNAFLVEAFNDVLKTEELYVAKSYADLSVREMHLIEEVCRAVDQGRDNRSSAIAAAHGKTSAQVILRCRPARDGGHPYRGGEPVGGQGLSGAGAGRQR